MNIAIILSGGIGSRMGLDVPKQYVKVQARMIISYCLSTFLNNVHIDAIVIACAEEWQNQVEDAVKKLNPHKTVKYAEAGKTRQYSIYNALLVAATISNSENDIVIIHDAARPLLSHMLINKCLEYCNDADGIMPVIPVKDTIYMSNDGIRINALLDRSKLWCGQAPEAFKLTKYLCAHEAMSQDEILAINGSTEIAFKAGLNCKMIEGDPMNFKITTPEDLSTFENIILNKEIQ